MNSNRFLQTLDTAANLVRQTFNGWTTPRFFIQFSAGFDLDGLFDDTPQTLALHRLPDMPEDHTPDNHLPTLLFGRCAGVPVLVAHGHRHLFEGLGPRPCILPTCCAWRLGTPACLFVDPVLGLRQECKTGSLTLLTDFVNGHAVSPLDGLLRMLPQPFPDMTGALSQYLISELVNALTQAQAQPRLCVYKSLPGAHFCTPAEAGAARAGHADIVGHDLVMEIITAHALERQTAAIGVVAGMAPDGAARPLRRAAILETCRFCSPTLMRGLRLACAEIWRDDTAGHASVLPEATADEALFQDFRRPSGREPALKRFLKKR